MREFELDPDKSATNLAKHGIGLEFGKRVFEDPDVAIAPSFRAIDGEDRYKAVGLVDGRLWTAVYVERKAVFRLISVRRSNHGERRDYDSYSGGPQ